MAAIDQQLNQLAADFRKALSARDAEIKRIAETLAEIRATPKSPEEELNAIPGKRIFNFLVQTQTFTTTQDGARASALVYKVSQDGPFIMTHFPIAIWRSTLPTNATDFGIWRPVCDWGYNSDRLSTNFISLSYEMTDNGTNQNFQDNAIPPIFSRPDNLIALPVPTKFAPNSSISFTPTYENIVFAGATATTQGTLVVALPGYRILGAR